MDEVDRANPLADFALEVSIQAVRERAPEAAPIGVCLNCGARMKRGLRWCDAACRDDWQAAQPKRIMTQR